MIHLGIVGIINFNDWDNPDYPETGGINSVVKNILPYLEADKIVLYGVTYDRANLFKEKKLDSRISVVPLVYMSSTSIVPKRVWCLLLGWRLGKYLKKHAIHVVYNHSEEMGFWLSFLSIPYVHHLHTYLNVLEVSGKRVARLKVFHTLWEKIRQRVMRKSQKIVAVNKDVVAMGETMLGKDRIIAFPNYVDSKQFRYRDFSALKNKLNLTNKRIALFLGRLSYVKGLELFVDIIQAQNTKASANTWKGIVIGSGDYRDTLVDYIRQKNLEDQIMLVGPINDPVVLSQYYSMADVFLITSLSESVPLTLLESLSCGTPVVSTAVGISSEVLNRSNGFVIGTRDAAAFANQIDLCSALKTKNSLLPQGSDYSVEFAARLLNEAFFTLSNKS
jgi:1,2-diacylglycerol 3-alpha-glucosyltransferase